jgi:hypothetical protein
MNHSRKRGPRFRRLAALVVGATVASLAGAVPAAATPAFGGCHLEQYLYFSDANRTVVGSREKVCNGTDMEPLTVIIKRNGATVASGKGIAVYHCVGVGQGTFRLLYTNRELTANCR